MNRVLSNILSVVIMVLVSACAGRQQVAVPQLDVPQNRYSWPCAEPALEALFCPLGYGKDGSLFWAQLLEQADGRRMLRVQCSAPQGTSELVRAQGSVGDTLDSLWKSHVKIISEQLAAAGLVISSIECAQLPVTLGAHSTELYLEADSAAGPEAGANWITGARLLIAGPAMREVFRIDNIAVYDLVLPGWVAAPDGAAVYVILAAVSREEGGVYATEYHVRYLLL